jgi:hypothetical protein
MYGFKDIDGRGWRQRFHTRKAYRTFQQYSDYAQRKVINMIVNFYSSGNRHVSESLVQNENFTFLSSRFAISTWISYKQLKMLILYDLVCGQQK